MRLKLVYQYLLVGLVVIGIFGLLLWQRSEYLLKNLIIEQSFQVLHEKNLAKVREIDSKINFYIVSSRDIYKQLSERKSLGHLSSLDQEVDPIIVGADLFLEKDGKYTLESDYANPDFLKSRNLHEDFFREAVGINPLNLQFLHYNNYFVQKLKSEMNGGEIVAIGVNLKSTDHAITRPHILVLYVDLLRFNTFFQFQAGYTQFMFEPLGGVISGFGDVFKQSINEYPPFIQMGELSVLKSHFKDSSNKLERYFSIMKSSYGYYIVTEVFDSEMYKPIYALKANYSLAFGIALSFMAILYLLMSFVSDEKLKTIFRQLDSFSDFRIVKLKFSFSLFADEFDSILVASQSALKKSVDSAEKIALTKKFSFSPMGSSIEHRFLSIEGIESQVLVTRFVFQNSTQPLALEDKAKFLERRLALLKSVGNIFHSHGGVLTGCDGTSITICFGLFCENVRHQIRGVSSALEIVELLKKSNGIEDNLSGFGLLISSGAVFAHEIDVDGETEFILQGKPMDEVQYMATWSFANEQKVIVTSDVVELSKNFFEFEYFLGKIPQAERAFYRIDPGDLETFILKRKIRDY